MKMKHRALFARGATAAIIIGTTCVGLAIPHRAAAQSSATLQNVIPQSEAVTLVAKIRKIDPNTRAVTLVGAEGNRVTVTAGPLVRLNMLKVGQTVTAKYYRSVAFIVNPPQGGNGVPVSNDQFTQVTAQPVEAPGGVAVRVIKISGTVVGIDLSSNSISLVNPSGGSVYTIDVTDPARVAALSSLKVGDTISAVVSQVLAVSIEPAPKGWF
jgi:Cu/Ag efflux protein CusF